MSVIEEVRQERARQINQEGWTYEHDDAHADGGLARAAACYAYPEVVTFAQEFLAAKGADGWKLKMAGLPRWPWDWSWWKPKGRRRDLIRAAALIVAEIERLDRAGAGT